MTGMNDLRRWHWRHYHGRWTDTQLNEALRELAAELTGDLHSLDKHLIDGDPHGTAARLSADLERLIFVALGELSNADSTAAKRSLTQAIETRQCLELVRDCEQALTVSFDRTDAPAFAELILQRARQSLTDEQPQRCKSYLRHLPALPRAMNRPAQTTSASDIADLAEQVAATGGHLIAIHDRIQRFISSQSGDTEHEQ